MLKKLLIGLFLLGMLCGAGSISAGGMFFGAGSGSSDGDSSSTTSPHAKSIVCGGGC